MKAKFLTCALLLLLTGSTLAVAQTSPLTVASPNGGDQWANGSAQTIVWSYAGAQPLDWFRILLSTDGGKTFAIVLADKLPNNATSFKWVVKAPDTPAALIKVMAQVAGVVPTPTPATIEDVSDKPFSIVTTPPQPIVTPTVKLVSPNGGETWAIGSTQLIQWKWSGTDVAQPRMFQLMLSTDGGKTFPAVIALDLPTGTMEYKWIVKAPESQMAILKIVAQIPVANPLLPALQPIEDVSDAPFTIASGVPTPIIGPASLSVISPRGREIWKVGSTQLIAWKLSGDFQPVRFMISLTQDGGKTYQTIADNLPLTSSDYKWTVKGVGSKTNLIKVTAIAGATAPQKSLEGVSPAPFAIIAAPTPMPQPIVVGHVTVISPNGGETWQDGQNVKIAWRLDGPQPASYTVLLSTDGGRTYPITIAPKVPGDQSGTTWIVSLNIVTPVKEARVKVAAMYPNQTPVEDISNSSFMIQPMPSRIISTTPPLTK